MKNFKQWLPDIVAVVLFAVISFAYFFPADIEGRILYRHLVGQQGCRTGGIGILPAHR